jgi:hypothetical protein
MDDDRVRTVDESRERSDEIGLSQLAILRRGVHAHEWKRERIRFGKKSTSDGSSVSDSSTASVEVAVACSSSSGQLP